MDMVLLTEIALDDIREQQHGLYQKVDAAEIDYNALFSLSLREMYEHFLPMSDYDKYVAIKNMPTYLFMSENTSLLLASVMMLPQELLKEICVYMMDGEIASDLAQEERDALKEKICASAEQFYKDPVEQAFDIYCTIKVGLSDTSKPIGPLYVASQLDRDALVQAKKLWYFMSAEEKELFDSVSDDFKQLYVQGREVMLLPDDVCTVRQLVIPFLISGGMTLLSFSGLTCGFSLVAGLVGIPLAVSCSSTVLSINGAYAGGCGSCLCCGIVAKKLYDVWSFSERVVI